MNGAERPTGNSPGSPDGHSGPVCVVLKVEESAGYSLQNQNGLIIETV